MTLGADAGSGQCFRRDVEDRWPDPQACKPLGVHARSAADAEGVGRRYVPEQSERAMELALDKEADRPRIVVGPFDFALGVQRRIEGESAVRATAMRPPGRSIGRCVCAPPWQPRAAVRRTSYEAGRTLRKRAARWAVRYFQI